MKTMMTINEKLFRLLGLLLCWATLIVDFILSTPPHGIDTYYPVTVFEYLSYMTTWTNVILALSYTVPFIVPTSKLSKFLSRPDIQSAILVYIIQVWLGYQIFLASLWDPTGLRKLTDLSLHYFAPAIYMLFWVLFVEKSKLKYKNIFVWLIYPIIYITYTLVKGAITNIYPYPFLDVNELGFVPVLITIAMFVVIYIVLGFLVVLTGKKLAKQN